MNQGIIKIFDQQSQDFSVYVGKQVVVNGERCTIAVQKRHKQVTLGRLQSTRQPLQQGCSVSQTVTRSVSADFILAHIVQAFLCNMLSNFFNNLRHSIVFESNSQEYAS